MRSTTITLAAATAAAFLALTACSSSNDDSKATPASSPTTESSTPTAGQITADPVPDAELSQAVKDYTTAYFAGDDGPAYEALSDRCQKKIAPEAYKVVVRQARTDYGPDHPATDVQTQVAGEMARVSYRVQGLPKFDQQAQPWVYETGDWKYDAC